MPQNYETSVSAMIRMYYIGITDVA